MYAVFRTGGKQYRATEGDRLKLEKIDAKEGADLSFDEVLLVGEGSDVRVGTPLLAGTTVGARVLKQGRGRKVGVTKFKRRVNYLRQHNHRQWFTEVEITSIGGVSRKPRPAPAAEEGEAAAAPEKAAPGKKTKKKVTKKKAATKSASGKKTAKKSSKKATKKKSAAKDE